MMTKDNHSTILRQIVRAALLLVILFAITRSAGAQSQWTTNGNNINNTNTGNAGIGTTNPLAFLHVASTSNATSYSRGIVLSQHTDDGNSGLFTLMKSRGTIASPLEVTNGDLIGSLFSGAYDGSSYVLGSRMRFAVDGTVTTGYIPTAIQFLTGIGGSVERMRLTSDGNVGIGTPAPGGKLHIVGGYATSGMANPGAASYLNATGASPNAGQLAFGDNTGWKFHFGTVSAGNFVERMTIMDLGNVGIGLTNPSYLLDVSGSTNTPFRVRDSSSREYFSTTTHTGAYGTSAVVNLGGGRLIVDTEGPDGSNNTVIRRVINSIIFPASDYAAYPGALIVRQLNGENILFVDQNTNGKVGIGTAGPNFKLDVQGGPVNAPGGLCIAGDCKTAWSQVGGGSSQWTTSGANIFYNSGNVGIGTSAAPTSRLQVNGDLTVSGTGNISASGTISGGNVVANYQDIAEWVSARKPMPAGTVVVLDVERSNQVVASQQAYDTQVAGAISDNPGVILGQAAENKVMVATTGRVRVKVDATRAPIRIGDILVTGDKEGIAMKSEPIDLSGAKIHRPGTIIGKALEPLANGVGEILVLLSLQ